jgi:DNA-binding NtrC family response regulator
VGSAAVLIVDDNDAMRMVCRVNLEASGYRVLEAESAAEAREAMESEAIALVLLDRRLLGADDGLVVAHEIRERYPGVAIVGISGTVPVPQAFTDVVDASVTKPFGVDELLETVNRFAPVHAR